MILTSTDIKWDQFAAKNNYDHLVLVTPEVAKEFSKFVCQQLQAEFSDQMGKCLLALALIQKSKTYAEAVGLAKDAALTGHMFEDGWSPITTAPKDDSKFVWLWAPGWTKVVRAKWSNFPQREGVWESRGGDISVRVPTHWHVDTVPKPPTT